MWWLRAQRSLPGLSGIYALALVLSTAGSGTAQAQTITVTAPNKAVNWAIGTNQVIKWNHSLGTGSSVSVEKLLLASDGSIASVETIASSVANATAGAGNYSWTVTGPAFGRVRIRVTAVTGAATDMSDVNFTIAAAYIQVSSPAAGTTWGHDTTQTQAWQTNLGPADMVDVQLSVDGGVTFPISLGSAAASARKVTFLTPQITTAQARVRVVWTNAPAGLSAQGTNPGNFNIMMLYIEVTSPNGGELWEAGTMRALTWATNYPKSDRVRIELSLDGGSSYSVVLAPDAKNNGNLSVVLEPAWLSSSARIRVTSKSTGGKSDTSNGSFSIYRGALLSNGRLHVVVRQDNGAIRAIAYDGTDFYTSGTAVSDFGFQTSIDTTTFWRYTTTGKMIPKQVQRPSVTWSETEIVAEGTYTAGGASVGFVRRYALVPGHDVLRVTTTFTNHGTPLVLSYFDTFEGDQGVHRGFGPPTFNDVYFLGGAVVGRSSDRGGLTAVLGSFHYAVTVAAGNPFWLDTGLTLNGFFEAPFDGASALADQGLHIGARFFLGAGTSETFTYDHAFGPTLTAAETQFLLVPR